jgi:hypothetical protein
MQNSADTDSRVLDRPPGGFSPNALSWVEPFGLIPMRASRRMAAWQALAAILRPSRASGRGLARALAAKVGYDNATAIAKVAHRKEARR